MCIYMYICVYICICVCVFILYACTVASVVHDMWCMIFGIQYMVRQLDISIYIS